MTTDYESIHEYWDPWANIPSRYNLGVDLTSGQVSQGLGDKVAIHWENAVGSHRSLTYRQLDRLSDRLAISLANLGIGRGDRVFIRLPNIPEFCISALAIAKLGAILVPSSPKFRGREVEFRISDSSAKAVITSAGLIDAVEESASRCPELKHVIVTSYPDSQRAKPSYVDFDSLISDDVDKRRHGWRPADTKSDDVALIAYTSATSGDPKGVAHFQRYPCAYEGLVRYWYDYRRDDVIACPVGLGWMYSMASSLLFPLRRGLTTVMYDGMGRRFDPQAWFGLLDRYRVTSLVGMPTDYQAMIEASDQSAKFNLSHWRHAVSAGELLSEATLRLMRHRFGISPMDGMGMTECMVYCCQMKGTEIIAGSCGRPTPGTMVRVMDEQMHPVARGVEGVVCIRCDTHPGLMKGYWNNQKRAAAIDRHAWYNTCDMAVRDSNGYFWFKGRAEDVIKASGIRISPFEIESCLSSHPAVLEAAVVGAPDALRGTVVSAYVVLRHGVQQTDAMAKGIQQFVQDRVEPHQYPRTIQFVASLPKTISGKTKRSVLREQAMMADLAT